MYLKRLEMQGFKSFAEPVTIEFHEGITCIVGPNGSGKSNISDAVRWVLGEQSPRMLRGGKMEEVIFSGTATRKARGMAEVTLVIDNTTGILPIDYNEVAITRRMYRSGESEYMINNNQCRLRDIRELIMDTGIGVEGYSIIGQGKIADIVSSKPESRREIFEEAAGVVMYKSKKAEAEHKLETAGANLERVNDIVGEIEGRIDGLRRDSAKAREYLDLKEKYQDLEINIILSNIEKAEEAGEGLKEDGKQLDDDISELDGRKRSLDDELTEKRNRRDALESQDSRARDDLMSKAEEINRIAGQAEVSRERLNTIDRDISRLRLESEGLNEKLNRELENARSMNEEKQGLVRNLATAEDDLREKTAAYDQVISREKVLSDDVDEERNRIFELRSQVSSKHSEAKSITSYKESLQKRKQQLAEEGENLESSVNSCSQSISQAEEEKARVDEQAEQIAASLKENESETQSCMKEERDLAARQEDLKIRSGQLSARKKTIEEMENNYEGYQSAVRCIMQDPGKGIRGVVADLMEVPDGFEVAIETALGGGMQNIVCDSDEDARAAIRMLKEEKAGRATFLPVNTIRSSSAKVDVQITGGSGYLGIAADRITFDEKYRGVFQYLLGRVVITDDMDHAVELSKKDRSGLRFVTLDGEVVNASGAITGGKYRNATANLLGRKKEIIKLSEEIDTLQHESRSVESKRAEISSRMAGLGDTRHEMEESYHRCQMSSASLKTKIESLAESEKEADESRAKRERELSSIDDELASAEKMIAELLSEAESGEREIEEINRRVSDSLTSLEDLKSQEDRAGEEITQTRITRNEWDSRVESCNQLLARIRETADDYQSQIDARTLEIDDLEREKKHMVSGSENSADLMQLREKEKADLEEYISSIGKEKASLSQDVIRLEEEQSWIGEQLNECRDRKYQTEIKMAKNETQLENFKEKLWNEFEVSYMQALEFRHEEFAVSTAVKESREIRSRMKQLGDVNVGAISEYEQVSQRYAFLTEQREDIQSAVSELKSIIADMDRTMKEKFKQNFDQVALNFEDVFTQLFGGGHAQLSLDDEDNPLEAGIEITAQPPGKKLQNINLMSGGEKTMTAIALMFAILKTRPTPFCILDEVEAALDDANIERFASYLREFDNIQFAIVTHQKATMEHADALYGVTMPEQGVSQVISLRLGDDFE